MISKFAMDIVKEYHLENKGVKVNPSLAMIAEMVLLTIDNRKNIIQKVEGMMEVLGMMSRFSVNTKSIISCKDIVGIIKIIEKRIG